MERRMVFEFENEELVEVIGHKKFLLSGKALSLLKPQKYYSDPDNPDEQLIEGFRCCLCPAGIGELQLNRVVYIMRGEEHFGNGHEYGCNNCAALFYGFVKFSCSCEQFTYEELNLLIQQRE